MAKIIDEKDLVVNNTRRVPTVLCIDTSSSMGWNGKLELLNEALVELYKELRKDALTKYAVDIAIVEFNEDVTKDGQFQSIRLGEVPQITKPEGQTHLAEAVDTALSMLERVKDRYKDEGVGYFQPWLVILSDGRSEGEEDDYIEQVSKRSSAAERANKLTVIPAFIGDPTDDDLAVFSKFSAVNKAQAFDASKLTDFARWLSQSLSTVAHSDASNEPKISFDDFREYIEAEENIG